jgi:hypothetical protein
LGALSRGGRCWSLWIPSLIAWQRLGSLQSAGSSVRGLRVTSASLVRVAGWRRCAGRGIRRGVRADRQRVGTYVRHLDAGPGSRRSRQVSGRLPDAQHRRCPFRQDRNPGQPLGDGGLCSRFGLRPSVGGGRRSRVRLRASLARAIVTAARERGDLPSVSGFKSMSGRGVEADVDGIVTAVGGPTLLRERGLEVPPEVETLAAGWRARGASVLCRRRSCHRGPLHRR